MPLPLHCRAFAALRMIPYEGEIHRKATANEGEIMPESRLPQCRQSRKSPKSKPSIVRRRCCHLHEQGLSRRGDKVALAAPPYTSCRGDEVAPAAPPYTKPHEPKTEKKKKKKNDPCATVRAMEAKASSTTDLGPPVEKVVPGKKRCREGCARKMQECEEEEHEQ
ncbi:hypothetical protein LR48_Vigan07g243400 [Vigna angularis]|uniref:Uncharacterized protein n=1 Tax=Phaseolus angularis TaxID=3914 RepID=A0A0L9V0S2_PHAAN|nr:hypothetical protein LR48_Vigan07g243400 [Vigna angularis]